MNYNFAQLNDKEVEILVCDLLSSQLNVHVERFRPGRDKGVDGRFFSIAGGEVIIQCKHYLNSGYEKLVAHLEKVERAKVVALAPERYIFATTLPLSKLNKSQIKKIFAPYITQDSDVLGSEDLNDLLAKFPEVEFRHYKLWVTSSTVLQNLLNAAIKGRSKHELQRIRNNAYLYVHTKDHESALARLDTSSVLIISGEPGIGKTTLAQNIALSFAARGFEFVDIEESISEAEAVHRSGKKQVFYFDDFLGSNYFEAIENKKDSHIVKFMQRIRGDKNKKLILTSRTNILNAGVTYSSTFEAANIRKDELLLEMSGIDQLARAKILYNHMWHSDLRPEFIEEIYIEKRYRQVIAHKNFNPRLIDFVLDTNRVSVPEPRAYWPYILAMLSNPSEIWGHAFKIQNDENARILVRATVLNGGNIAEQELRDVYRRYEKLFGMQSNTHIEKDFGSVARRVTKSFLNRTMTQGDAHYSLFNPSIADFVLSDYADHEEKLGQAFRALGTISSLKQLVSLAKSGEFSQDLARNLLRKLLQEARILNKSWEYIIQICGILRNDSESTDEIVLVLEQLINVPKSLENSALFFQLACQQADRLDFKDFGFVAKIPTEFIPDSEDIESLAEFIDKYAKTSDVAKEVLREQLEYFLANQIDHHLGDIEMSDYIRISWYDEEMDVDVDIAGIREEVREIVTGLAANFEYECISECDWDLEYCVETVDYDKLADDYVQSQHEEESDWRGGGGGGLSSFDAIDDIFDRS